MARLIASFLLVWTFLLGPALCAGGLLEHACECGDGVELQCQHEDSCSDDPCVLATRTAERQALRSLEFLEFMGPCVSAAVLGCAADPDRVRRPCSRRPSVPPDRWSLPYAQSDRPLLI